jgi:hypothetical protein
MRRNRTNDIFRFHRSIRSIQARDFTFAEITDVDYRPTVWHFRAVTRDLVAHAFRDYGVWKRYFWKLYERVQVKMCAPNGAWRESDPRAFEEDQQRAVQEEHGALQHQPSMA